jgi:hypothetical protein
MKDHIRVDGPAAGDTRIMFEPTDAADPAGTVCGTP